LGCWDCTEVGGRVPRHMMSRKGMAGKGGHSSEGIAVELALHNAPANQLQVMKPRDRIEYRWCSMLAKALGLRERTGVASEDHMGWAMMRIWVGNEVPIDTLN
jgi:hypothetical protein